MNLYRGWVGVSPGTTMVQSGDSGIRQLVGPWTGDAYDASARVGGLGATQTFDQGQLEAAVAVLVQWKNTVVGYLSDHPSRGGDDLVTDQIAGTPVSDLTPDPDHDYTFVPDARIAQVEQASSLISDYIHSRVPDATIDNAGRIFGPASGVAAAIDHWIQLTGIEPPIPLWPWLLFGFSVLALGLFAFSATRKKHSNVHKLRVHKGRDPSRYVTVPA